VGSGSGEKVAAGWKVGDEHKVRVAPHLLKPPGARPIRKDKNGASIVGSPLEASQVVVQDVRNLVEVGVAIYRLVSPVLFEAAFPEKEASRGGEPEVGELGVGPFGVAASVHYKWTEFGLQRAEDDRPKGLDMLGNASIDNYLSRAYNIFSEDSAAMYMPGNDDSQRPMTPVVIPSPDENVAGPSRPEPVAGPSRKEKGPARSETRGQKLLRIQMEPPDRPPNNRMIAPETQEGISPAPEQSGAPATKGHLKIKRGMVAKKKKNRRDGLVVSGDIDLPPPRPSSSDATTVSDRPGTLTAVVPSEVVVGRTNANSRSRQPGGAVDQRVKEFERIAAAALAEGLAEPTRRELLAVPNALPGNVTRFMAKFRKRKEQAKASNPRNSPPNQDKQKKRKQ